MRYAKLLAVSLLASGCYAQVEQPDVCLTVADQKFPGSPLGGLGEQKVAVPFNLEPALPDQPLEDVEVQLTSLTARSDGDLGFLDSLEVSADGVGELASYERSGDVQHEVDATPTGDVDLGPVLKNHTLHLTAVVAGSLPPEEWTADVEACFHVKARAQWFP